jgi:hypothetical protein
MKKTTQLYVTYWRSPILAPLHPCAPVPWPPKVTPQGPHCPEILIGRAYLKRQFVMQINGTRQQSTSQAEGAEA